jgi:hypothetical protein
VLGISIFLLFLSFSDCILELFWPFDIFLFFLIFIWIVVKCMYTFLVQCRHHHHEIDGNFDHLAYGSWIYNYLCNQCQSPLKLWIRTPFMAYFRTVLAVWYFLVLPYIYMNSSKMYVYIYIELVWSGKHNGKSIIQVLSYGSKPLLIVKWCSHATDWNIVNIMVLNIFNPNLYKRKY